MPAILFLDFDGVLHPEPCHDTPQFCRMPLFERAMAQLPGVDIVVSSSWRHGRTLADLRALLAEALRARIVGMTPQLKDFQDGIPLVCGSKDAEEAAPARPGVFAGAGDVRDEMASHE